MKVFITSKNYIVILVLLLTLVSCERDTFNGIDRETQKGVSINFSFDELQSRGGVATSEEKVIHDATLVFYDANSDVYVGHSVMSVESGATSIVLNLPDEIQEGVKYKVIALGNYRSYPPKGMSIDQYIKSNSQLKFENMKREITAQTISSGRVLTPLPFSGILIGTDNKEALFVGPGSETTKLNVSIRFSRVVARFNLQNLAAHKLVIQSVKVCNYRSSGFFFDSDASTSSEIVNGVNNNAGILPGAPVINGKQEFMRGGLYAFPNLVPYISQDDKVSTCLLIAGYFQEEGKTPNTDKLTYYRANIGKNGRRQIIRRNHYYNVIITNVTGEGAEDENEAMDENDILLEYEVGEDWDADDDNVVTDEKGNFILLSRTFVVLDSNQGEEEIVSVSINQGANWSYSWKPDSGDAQEAFDIDRISDKSFRITTKKDNKTPFVNKGSLIIKHSKSNIQIEVSIVQVSVSGEQPILVVEGKTGAFDIKVPGQGGVVTLQVLTGGRTGWVAHSSNNLDHMINSITTEGANKAYINIVFKPNTSHEIKEGGLVVSRVDGNPEVEDVEVHFTQGTSPYLISITPDLSEHGLVIDGFTTRKDRPNGVALSKKFWVHLADPNNYDFEVTTTFQKDLDAFAFIATDGDKIGTMLSRKSVYNRPETEPIDSISKSEVDASVFFCVFRTGPSDPDLRGSIIFKAIPKEDTVGLTEQTVSIPVTIKSSAVVGDVILENYLIMDRNCGSITRDEEKLALNYSDSEYHKDHKNKHFRGQEYKFSINGGTPDNRAMAVCTEYAKKNYTDAKGLELLEKYDFFQRPPDKVANLFNSAGYISKERFFLVSEETNELGQQVAAYIPYVSQLYWLNAVSPRSKYFFKFYGDLSRSRSEPIVDEYHGRYEYHPTRCIAQLRIEEE